MLYKASASISAIVLLHALPAQAALPDPVKAMIEAAIASKNDADVQTVVKLAKSTNPDDVAEIEIMLTSYIAEKAALIAAEEQKKLQASFFENWSGQGELGGFHSTGNTNSTGISASLKLKKEGVKWRHNLRALADYQRTNGTTNREQFLAAYEPNYKFNERFYAFGLAQYERDRFQGFSSRTTLSGGLGYAVVKSDDTALNIKVGPAWRKTRLIGGGSDTSLSGLAELDSFWQISDNLRLTQDLNALVESDNSTFTSTTGLEAKLIGALSARLSYSWEHETDPPLGVEKTDKISRATLVYDF
ncbi:MAG: DUF481 domain-containing protein [Parasphingorhabdus sp.]